MLKNIGALQYRKFPGSLDFLQAARDYVAEICSSVPVEEVNFLFQMQLAINEMFCNIVKHGYKQRPHCEISISSKRLDNGIAFYILDEGRPFFFGNALGPHFNGPKENGYGCLLLKEIMDLILYVNKNPYFPRNQHFLFKKFG